MSASIFLQNWPFAKLRLKRNSYLRDKIELTTYFFSLKSSSNFMNYKFDSLLIVCLRREDLEGDLWNSGHRFRLVVTSVTVPKAFYKIILVRFQAVSTYGLTYLSHLMVKHHIFNNLLVILSKNGRSSRRSTEFRARHLGVCSVH